MRAANAWGKGKKVAEEACNGCVLELWVSRVTIWWPECSRLGSALSSALVAALRTVSRDFAVYLRGLCSLKSLSRSGPKAE